MGRADAWIGGKDRELVFEIYCTYRDLRKQGVTNYDWDDIATAVVCTEFDADNSPRRYRHIIEQDFHEIIRS